MPQRVAVQRYRVGATPICGLAPTAKTHKNKFLLECGQKALNNTRCCGDLGTVCVISFLHIVPIF